MRRRDFLGLMGLCVLAPSTVKGEPVAFDFSRYATAPTAKFSWEGCRFAWDYSQIAYNSVPELRDGTGPEVPQVSGIGDWTKLASFDGEQLHPTLDNTQALLWDRGDFVLVGFRGTEGDLIEAAFKRRPHYCPAMKDVLTDFRARPRALPQDKKIRVHQGFYKAVEHIWPRLREPLRRLNKPLILVGHSLGGGLAGYAAYKAVREENLKVEAVYTFASPRIGNSRWAEVYGELGLDQVTLRFANALDWVTRLPPEDLGYRHVGRPVVFRPDGSVTADWSDVVRSHPFDLHKDLGSLDKLLASRASAHLQYGPVIERAARLSPHFGA